VRGPSPRKPQFNNAPFTSRPPVRIAIWEVWNDLASEPHRSLELVPSFSERKKRWRVQALGPSVLARGGDRVILEEIIMSLDRIEPHTPTRARVMPMGIRRWNSFSPTNASQSEAKIGYVELNTQTPCPPRGAVPVNSRRTWEIVSLYSFGAELR
jgi:hypothetical protein